MGTIWAEIQQARQFDHAEAELVVTLWRTSEMVRDNAVAALKPWGISPEQYNVLRILRGAPDGSQVMREVASRMICGASGIRRLVEGLAAKGLIRRERGPGDRRAATLRIVPRGLRVLRECDEAILHSVILPLSVFQKNRIETMVDGLDSIRELVGASLGGRRGFGPSR
jgi:DNA-binding MarR family transcriptional regulator